MSGRPDLVNERERAGRAVLLGLLLGAALALAARTARAGG
jgi:hypothetical protein